MKLIETRDSKEALYLAFTEVEFQQIKNEIISFMTQENGYKLKKEDQNKGTNLVFEKGNRIMRLLFGAFVTYHKQSFQILDETDKILVAFRKSSSGISGGALGVRAVKKEFARLKGQLESRYQLDAIGVN